MRAPRHGARAGGLLDSRREVPAVPDNIVLIMRFHPVGGEDVSVVTEDYGGEREGDNLYSNCMLALDARAAVGVLLADEVEQMVELEVGTPAQVTATVTPSARLAAAPGGAEPAAVHGHGTAVRRPARPPADAPRPQGGR